MADYEQNRYDETEHYAILKGNYFLQLGTDRTIGWTEDFMKAQTLPSVKSMIELAASVAPKDYIYALVLIDANVKRIGILHPTLDGGFVLLPRRAEEPR